MRVRDVGNSVEAARFRLEIVADLVERRTQLP
jgi:hypothetical protein